MNENRTMATVTLHDREQAHALMAAAIRLILEAEWDPAGLAGEPYARQEYELYVPGIHRLLRHNRPESELTAYLRRVEAQYLGRGSSRAELEAVARKLQGLGVGSLG